MADAASTPPVNGASPHPPSPPAYDPPTYVPWNPRLEQELRRRQHGDADGAVNGLYADQSAPAPGVSRELLPGGRQALSDIALHGFGLGVVFAVGALMTVYCVAARPSRLWRAPFFLAVLAVFHFLEFYMTATHNTARARVSSFLLFTNGAAYNLAHSAALAETLLTGLVFPRWQAAVARPPAVAAGLVLIAVGQATRSAAMAHAGTNFHHIVQFRKTAGHRLVTDGVYAVLRHPAYFGFFWWALGTQLVLGNVACFCAFVPVLYRFFRRRIRREEESLVAFFGDEYVKYHAKTWVGIPFIS